MGIKNKKEKEKKIVSQNVNGEEAKNVSYFELFKYSTGKDKLMTFIGVLGSLLQGATIPLMINCTGDMTNVFISLVVNTTFKKITGIEDDSTLTELVDLFKSNNSTLINDFGIKHPDININQLMDKYHNSNYADYSFTGSKGSFEFKPINEVFHDLYHYLLVFGIIGVLAFIASFCYYAFLNISSNRQIFKIRSLVFNSLMKQEISWHEKTNSGELSSRIISDTLLIGEGIGIKLGILIQNLFSFVACFIIAFVYGWKLTLYMAIIIPVLGVIIGIMSSLLKKYTGKMLYSYGVVGGIAQEAFSQIRTIVSFGNEQKEINRYVENLKPTKTYGIIKAQTYGICLGLIYCAVYCTYSIAFVKGTQYIHDGKMVAGDVLKVFMGVMMGALTISGCGTILNAFAEATGAASKLFHIIDRKPKIDDEIGEKPETSVNGEIEFQNVHFAYPARPDVEILKGISFKCQPGQTIALVGASGSGKSTIVQLLERYYDRNDGHILIDGKNIEDYNIHWLRTQIGIVSQEPTLFDATIAENIAITCPEATEEQIINASKLANAHEFISKLPKGYQTSTGERGLQLSGGQKQRICIARALMMNPKILLLDEATSALDNQSEKIVQSALDSASTGRTTLIIAHRLSTIKNADCIIVMDQGVIVESGTHDELMSLQKVYYNLVKDQEMNIQNNESVNDDNYDPDAIIMEPVDPLEEDIANSDSNAESDLLTKQKRVSMVRVTSKSSQRSVKKNNKESNEGQAQAQPINWARYIYYNKPVWFVNLLGFLGSIFNGCIQPAFAYIFASAMNVFNMQGQDLIKEGRFWGWMFVLLGIAYFISTYCQTGCFATAGEHLSYAFRKEMYNSIIRQEVGFFDSNNGSKENESNGNDATKNSGSTGTLTAKLTTEASLVQGLNTSIGSLFEILVTVVVGFTIAFVNGWKLTLALLIAVPFLFIGIFIQMKSEKNLNEDKRLALENSTKVAVESISNIKTVYALNLEDRFRKLYHDNLVEPESRLERKYYSSAIGTGFSGAVAYFAYILGFYVGAVFIKNGELEFQNMFRVILAIIFTALAAGRASSIAPSYAKAAEAFAHVLEIIDRPSKINASDPKGIKDVPMNGHLSFKNIRFAYPSRPDVTVLRLGDGEVKVPEGKSLAIVGGSGSGKSTIIGLIPRWYDAQHGEILIDGERNVDYNIKWLRQHIGIVNQEPSLFNISIKDNIRYGKEDATDEEIVNAAKKANIHDFIMSLPEKYDTIVGSIGTSQMSGGQKQRIAIARAIIRNPKILLLDEATSALDAESELIVQKALEEISQGRTTITIAHRLSTIKNADIIVVMKDGKIIEQGNHNELMNKKGEYYEMVLAGDGGIHKTQ